MARRKDPEGTLNLILDVAEQLFMERGYEQTSIQDIIDGLGGLSKGAIYHHFKSKDEIFGAVAERSSQPVRIMFDQLAADETLNGLEKLQQIFALAVSKPRGEFVNRVAPRMLDNPHLICSYMNQLFDEVAKHYLRPIIQQGIDDGSLPVADATAFSEYLLLLVNVWLNPLVHFESIDHMVERFRLFKCAMDGLGLPLVNDDFEAPYMAYCAEILKAQQPTKTRNE